MKKLGSTIIFIDDYDVVRRFLNFLAYGCYSKRYIKERTGCSEKYPAHWAGYLMDILPENVAWRSYSDGHDKRLQLINDSYYGRDNYLAETYYLKSISEKKFICCSIS